MASPEGSHPDYAKIEQERKEWQMKEAEETIDKYVDDRGRLKINTSDATDVAMNTAMEEQKMRDWRPGENDSDYNIQADEAAKIEITKKALEDKWTNPLDRALAQDDEKIANSLLQEARKEHKIISEAYDKKQSQADKQKIDELRTQIKKQGSTESE